jgi:hypothetical protein
MAASIGDQFGNYIVQTGLGLAASTATLAASSVAQPSADAHGTGPSSRPVPPAGAGFTVSAGPGPTPSPTRFSAAPVEARLDADKSTLLRFSVFTSSVERHIASVRQATFGKKMEAKLDHAQKLLRHSFSGGNRNQSTPGGNSGSGRGGATPTGPKPQHHHQPRRSNATPPHSISPTQAMQPVAPTRGTPPPEPTLRRRLPTSGGDVTPPPRSFTDAGRFSPSQ